MTTDRCDRALPNGNRCKNTPTQWVRCTVDFAGKVEIWPMAVCDLCAKEPGPVLRLGPDRRRDYAAIHPELSEQLGVHADAPT